MLHAGDSDEYHDQCRDESGYRQAENHQRWPAQIPRDDVPPCDDTHQPGVSTLQAHGILEALMLAKLLPDVLGQVSPDRVS